MLNIKEHIYNFYKMMGPVKPAWHQILTQHSSLTNLLIYHLRNSDTGIDYRTLGNLTQLVESVERKRGISSCKFEHSVREGENLIQFKYNALRPIELIFLQVLAQYAYYDYEII
jgi:hypothetical protein